MKLVLSGSGMLFPIHIGAVKRLKEEFEIDDICGVSGGAIVSAMIASGVDDVEKIMLNNLPSQKSILDPSILFPKHMGVLKGDKIEKIFDKFFVNTFKETKIPLKVITANLNKMDDKVFSSSRTPDFSVSKAVRASMSIPGIFKPVKIDDEYHIDGGVISNFPLDIYGPGKDVLGVRIQPDMYKKRKIKNFFDFAVSLGGTIMDAMAQDRIDNAVKARCISIPTTHSGIDFAMTKGEAKSLVKKGYNSVDGWLENHVISG